MARLAGTITLLLFSLLSFPGGGIALTPLCCASPIQSIYQDDSDMQYKGVRSLITYATQCSYMLIPVDLAQLSGLLFRADKNLEELPDYGKRGWYVHWPCHTRVVGWRFSCGAGGTK